MAAIALAGVIGFVAGFVLCVCNISGYIKKMCEEKSEKLIEGKLYKVIEVE